MSAPAPFGYADSGDSAEHKKDRTQNNVIRNPGDACAEERHGGEQSKIARLGVHSCPDLKGAATRLPLPSARVDGLEPPMRKPCLPRRGTAGHLSGSDRATRCPTGIKPRRGATLVGQSRLALSTNW